MRRELDVRRTNWITIAVRAISLAAVLQAFVTVHAGRPGFRNFDFVIDAEVFKEVASNLRLSAEQETVAKKLFEEYLATITTMEREAEDAITKAGRTECSDLVRQALRSGQPLDERARVLYQAYRAESIAWLRRADTRLEEFMHGLEQILSESQQEQLPSAKRLIRRMNDVRYPADKDEGTEIVRRPDLLGIVDQASTKDAELAWLRSPSTAYDSDKLDRARATIQGATLDYEVQLDAVLVARMHRNRQPPLSGEEPIWSADSPGGKRRQRETADEWQARWRAASQGQSAIHGALEELGGGTLAARWAERWRAQAHPALARAWLPDRIYEWLDERLNDHLVERESLDVAYEEYLVRRDEILLDMISLLVATRQTPENNEANDRRLEDKRLAVRELVATTARRMRSACPEDCKAAYDAQVTNLLASDMRLAGPVLAAQHRPLSESRPSQGERP